MLNLKACFDYTINTLLELCKSNLCELLHGFAIGRVPHYDFYNSTSLGVRMTLPPFPVVLMPTRRVFKFDPQAQKHIWFKDVCRTNGEYVCGTVDGDVCYVTARANSISEARQRVYRTINNMDVKSIQYRTDVGKRVNTCLRAIQPWIIKGVSNVC